LSDGAAANAFWAYAVEVYAMEQVRDACLRLQDRSDHHVNLLLAAMWLTASKRQIGNDAADRIRTKCNRFQENVTKPLRTVRRNFWEGAKPYLPDGTATNGAEDLRARIKDAELWSERFEIEMLAPILVDASREVDGSPLLGWSNFEALTPWVGDDRADLRILLEASVTKPS
jgi:uncharacterized protein (TIGR02444 family)